MTAEITVRPMAAADISASVLVRKAAGEWLRATENRAPGEPWTPERPLALLHFLRTDPGGSWVAEMNGVLVAYAQAFVRGDIWYLAQLFVLPEIHNHGAGARVLAAAQRYGSERGARIFAVSASTSQPAHGLYMRAGMYANGIGYRLRGPVAPLCALPAPVGRQNRIVDCEGWRDRIAALDREVWGAERREDRAWLMSGEFQQQDTAFGLSEGGELLGCGHAADDGWIGMVSAREPGLQPPLLCCAGEWLRERGVEQGTLYCLSQNQTVLGTLLGAGWRITDWTFPLASEPWGRFDRYVPAGGMML
jgi:GNAT superfamily N-acetyltransferase